MIRDSEVILQVQMFVVLYIYKCLITQHFMKKNPGSTIYFHDKNKILIVILLLIFMW